MGGASGQCQWAVGAARGVCVCPLLILQCRTEMRLAGQSPRPPCTPSHADHSAVWGPRTASAQKSWWADANLSHDEEQIKSPGSSTESPGSLQACLKVHLPALGLTINNVPPILCNSPDACPGYVGGMRRNGGELPFPPFLSTLISRMQHDPGMNANPPTPARWAFTGEGRELAPLCRGDVSGSSPQL